MGYKEYFCILLFMLSKSLMLSQEKHLEKGNLAFTNLAYVKAIKIYEKCHKRGACSKEMYENLADSYYYTFDFEKAVFWYKKLIVNFSGDLDTLHIDRYANCLRAVEEYKEAAKVKRYLANDLTENLGMQYLNEIKKSSHKFVLDTLQFNSKYADYAPSYYGEDLVFTSSRISGINTKWRNKWNGEPFLDLYNIPSSKINNKRGDIHKLKGSINTPFHESSTAFSKDLKTVYFTRNNFHNKKVGRGKNGLMLLKIYRATYDGQKWGKVEELPFNGEDYSITHPSLSKDGKLLYFVSDMPGGYGQTDLYVVDIKEDGSFGEPRNLGYDINTEGRETFPYIADSGRLFFASDGHKGLGGLDIFAAWTDTFENLIIENLGEPINTSKDDFSFIINEDKGTGYFASNRAGGKGGDDIYGFTLENPFPENYYTYRVIKRALQKRLYLQPDHIGTQPAPVLTSN